MDMSLPIHPRARLGNLAFDAVAISIVFGAYLGVFFIVRDNESLLSLIILSLTNAIPIAFLTYLVRPVIRRHLIGTRAPIQVVGHVLLGLIFSLSLHWIVLVLVGIRAGGSITEFSVQDFFSGPALVWQLLQGFTFYALIASLTYLRAQAELPIFIDTRSDDDEDEDPCLSRYFIRQGDEIHPIDVTQIVSITGADDYAEVSTAEGQHLVRTTLAKFESSLDPKQFLRVHRSRIVNLHQISRAELSGDSRMTLHMTNQERIRTSRSGAKLLRDRVI